MLKKIYVKNTIFFFFFSKLQNYKKYLNKQYWLFLVSEIRSSINIYTLFLKNNAESLYKTQKKYKFARFYNKYTRL